MKKITFADIESQIKKYKAIVAERMNNTNGYVLCNKTYVKISGDGINHTHVTPTCIVSASEAVVYSTKEDAYKYGQDFYLRDGRGNDILLEITDCKEYFKRELEIAEDMLSALQSVA